VNGDVGGGSSALDQLIFRPIPSLSPYRTPIDGLYLGSASTFPGAGVNGIAGEAAARCAIRDTRFRVHLFR
jgi:phytoene dehydrogenase-like protein